MNEYEIDPRKYIFLIYSQSFIKLYLSLKTKNVQLYNICSLFKPLLCTIGGLIEMENGPQVIGYLEDEDSIRESFVELLEDEGYRVLSCQTREEALGLFLNSHIDLALLDIELVNDAQGGLKVCRKLRDEFPDLPIIFLTSHLHIDMKSRGWRLGADDYVTKDTEIDLVLLRVKALLKRYSMLKEKFSNSEDTTKSKSKLTMDNDNYRVKWEGKRIDLSLTQYWLFSAIVRGEGAPVNQTALQKSANIVVESNTIVAHIKSIRDSFKRIDPGFDCIKTERGKGYRWVSE